MRILTLLFLVGFVFNGCSDPTGDAHTMKAQPVTVLELHARDFSQEVRFTGSVSLYREEKVGFEVSGRVLAVLDEGAEIEGPAVDEHGKLIRPGDVIATVDDTRHRQRFEAVQARRKAVQREVEAVHAAMRLAIQNLRRQKSIFVEGAGSQQAVDEAQSNFERQRARKAEREAVVRAITEELKQAKEDVEDSTLRAPFSGRITRLHVGKGAVVEPGAPVVTLTLMDPIQIQVSVSADDDRRIQTGDRAIIFPKDPLDVGGKPTQMNAIVYEKGAVADPNTRTFRINLMVRNERRRIEQIDPTTKGLPVVRDFLPVVRRFRGEEGNLFVHTESIYRERGQSFVLRLPGVSFHPGARRSAVGKHLPEKVGITLGEDYFTVVKWTFRSLQDSGDLREGDFLVVNPKQEHLNGLAIGRPQWLLRPGDLIPVQFLVHKTPRGFYVPVDAITKVDGKHVVYVVEGTNARMAEVTVHESYRELRRVEGEHIDSGSDIVVDGVHYLSDGQPVTIVDRTGSST